ncbi:MAG: hypothetical protein H6555_11655 [Lewinellaceae bacterium]|nr:hypothetical protein [Lewinellaceae bacterium]
MKFRCTSDSIRFRVRKSDLEILRTEGRLVETIHFPGGNALQLALSLTGAPSLSAAFANHTVEVGIPRDAGLTWIGNEEVGLSAAIPVAQGATLHILVEKDFPCRHTTEANRDDTFHELVPPELRDDQC